MALLTSSNKNFKEHTVYVKSYKKPTFCNVCNKLLVGLYKQGVKCEACKGSFHENCYKSDVCNQINIFQIESDDDKNSYDLLSHDDSIDNIRFIKINRTDMNNPLPNCFKCKKKIKGNLYYKNEDGNVIIHYACLPSDLNVIKKIDDIKKELSSIEKQKPIDHNHRIMPINDNKDSIKYIKLKQDTIKILEKRQKKKENLNAKVNNSCFWEGTLPYTINENPEVFKHFWRLDGNDIIHIYDSSKLDDKVHEIHLKSIKKSIYDTNSSLYRNLKPCKYPCKFYLITNDDQFNCGVVSNKKNQYNVFETAANFFNIFKLAYLKYSEERNKSFKITAPKFEEKKLNDEYELFNNQILGIGSFGKVYAGISRETKQNVAIKAINTKKHCEFDTDIKYSSEICILYNLKHPGIVKLLAIFYDEDYLFIVMERLSIDLLDKIKQHSKLCERVTKFIGYQILTALNYLHTKQIGHCDLKPENIILTENIELPHVKICDFGYAKLIYSNSVRKTRIGTDSYNPPEIDGENIYNKTTDIWSVGVILYVCLSGVLPFDENHRIIDQVNDLDYLFPSDPWDTISRTVINLIRSEMLQPKIQRRSNPLKILENEWFTEDSQLYCDLEDLERKLKNTDSSIQDNWLMKLLKEKWNM